MLDTDPNPQQKHTPGPWVQEGWTVIADRKTRSKRGMVASCASAPMYEKQWTANATLIAAAPDLLATLKGAAEWLRETYALPACGDEGAQELLVELEVAIGKAEGRIP